LRCSTSARARQASTPSEVLDGVELLEVRRDVVARRELELRVAAQREGTWVRHGRSQAVGRAEVVEARTVV
jgi:hypothetical protein